MPSENEIMAPDYEYADARDRPMHYILDGHVVLAATWEQATAWRFSDEGLAAKIVGQEVVGSFEVSTVFIGEDHNPLGGAPHVFETILFPVAQVVGRCSTWEAAEEMHRDTVARLRGEQG